MNFVAEAGSFVNKQDPNADPKAKDAPQVQDVMCVEFLANGNIVTGMASGDIYLWKPMAETHGMQVGGRRSYSEKSTHTQPPCSHTQSSSHALSLPFPLPSICSATRSS